MKTKRATKAEMAARIGPPSPRGRAMSRAQALLAQIAAAKTFWVLIGIAGYWRAHGIRLPREVSEALDDAIRAASAEGRQ